MKLKMLILSGAVFTLVACSDSNPKKEVKTNEEETVEKVDYREVMYGWADTLETVADSLEQVYNRVISEAARISPDSVSVVELKYKATATNLNKEITRLTESITSLRSEKKVTEADYQELVSDIDMSGVSTALDKLKLLNINLEDGSLGDTSEKEGN